MRPDEITLRRVFCVLLLALFFAGCTGSTDETFVDPEACANRADDDGDGLTDCADPDCRDAEPCAGQATEHCYDLVDNDFDGETDCADTECAARIVCVAALESCTSGEDDDNDGDVDCDDDDCAGTASCIQNGEQCTNGEDDDGDGSVDCDDSDCAATDLCGPRPESCDTDVDEDEDGDAGCDDSECARTALCTSGGEDCANGADDDGDGRTDCLDSDCAYTRACLGGVEVCTNGVDDDGDGLADCLDEDCASRARCQTRPEVCDNRIDDDGDGLFDCGDPDCVAQGACELCDNATDDDGDGAVDCADSSCFFTPSCVCEGSSGDLDGDDIPDCYDDDIDGDDRPNGEDDCPRIANPTGDCPADSDGDGVLDDQDNCPSVPNPDQAVDAENIPIACLDIDGDAIYDDRDNCPSVFNPRQIDRDDWLFGSTLVGDVCDTRFDLLEHQLGQLYRAWVGTDGFRLGSNMTYAGDVNGDGFDDLLVSSSGLGPGTVRLLYGPFEVGLGGESIDNADATFVYSDPAAQPSAQLGRALAHLGDVNGDGFDDIAFSASEHDSGNGAVFIFYGRADLEGEVLVASADVTITDATSVGLGDTLSAPGDFTGDGTSDLIVREAGASSNSTWHFFAGETIFGAGASFDTTDAAFARDSQAFPAWQRPTFHLADYDGDGFPDWFVANPDGASGSGTVGIYRGHSDPTLQLQPGAQLTLTGDGTSDRFGTGFALVPDASTADQVDIAVSSLGVQNQPTRLGETTLYTISQSASFVQRADLWADSSISLDGDVEVVRDLTAPGSVDLLVTSRTSQTVAVTLFFGEEVLGPAGSSAERRQFVLLDTSASTASTVSDVVVEGDWNGDGYRDLLIASEGAGDFSTPDNAGVIWMWPNVWHVGLR